MRSSGNRTHGMSVTAFSGLMSVIGLRRTSHCGEDVRAHAVILQYFVEVLDSVHRPFTLEFGEHCFVPSPEVAVVYVVWDFLHVIASVT